MKILPGKTYSIFMIKEFLKVFFISIIFIMGLSFIVRTIQRADVFKQYKLYQVIIIRLLEAPEIISRECLLASSMFAAVYTMSSLTGSREVLALRSCGVSIYRVMSPLIIMGLIIAVGSLLFEDLVVVKSIRWQKEYKAKLQGVSRSYYRDRFDLIIFGEKGRVFKIDRYRAGTKEMDNLLILRKNDEGRIIERIDAEKAKWNGETWILYKGVIRRFDNEGNLVYEQNFDRYKSNIKDEPRAFARPAISIKNMTIRDGLEYLHSLKRMGLPSKRDETKFHRRIARSFTLFLVIIIGLSFGSMQFRNIIVISFSLTLGVVLLFFFIIEIGYTFGSSGKIPPFLGGWLGNIVFSFISIYLMNRLRI